MIELHRITKQISDLLEDQKTLLEIKRIMHNDGTIGIVEQITHLQANTQVTNINKLRTRLDKISDSIEEINGEFGGNYSEVEDAIRSLESVTEYSDYMDESQTAINDLRDELEALSSEQENELNEESNTPTEQQ
tara:strand:+ start:1133 stop:1534 length:402 start_codon:yes stop_codon:yes gene_type:complete